MVINSEKDPCAISQSAEIFEQPERQVWEIYSLPPQYGIESVDRPQVYEVVTGRNSDPVR